MKESETDKILFSNISYLKQFRLNKMGAEVVISDRFLISKFLKGLTHCAMCLSCSSIYHRVFQWFHFDLALYTFLVGGHQLANDVDQLLVGDIANGELFLLSCNF